MTKKTDASANNHAYSSIFQGTGVEDFKKCIQHHLLSFQGRDPERAGDPDVYRALPMPCAMC